MIAQLKLYLAALVAGVLLGMGAGWGLWHPRAVPVEVAAPSVHQKDSSLVLARRPDTALKVTNIVPRGWVRERDASIAVQPPSVIVHDSVRIAGEMVVKVDTVHPPPVHIALTLVRQPDGTQRIIARSPDGGVLDSLSVDVPRGEAAAPARVLRWSAGVTRDVATAAWGAIVSRDVGPVRVFAAGEPAQAGLKGQLKVGIGLRF